MASYKCIKCGHFVSALQPGMVRCPSCANRILYKMRDNVAKDIKAR